LRTTLAVLTLATCSALAQSPSPDPAALRHAEAAITPAGLLEPIRELSSDAYTGRAPGTEGETKSVAYITARAKSLGLEPGNPDGTYIQKVPLWGMLPEHGSLTLTAGGAELPLTSGGDYTVWTSLPKSTVDVANSPVVFAGYGVVAPEYHWDDYAGLDVHGKTVVLLSGDPAVADPSDPTKLDPRMFLGPALTVYGRTGTKLDIAYEHGAAAVILLLAPPASAIAAPQRLFENYTRESMTLRDTHDREHVAVQAVLTNEAATQLFHAAGADLAALRASAAKPGFHGTQLSAKASLHLTSRVRQVDSANVIAKITGSDPRLRSEYVIYSGHWDHHGQVGDKIYHGASDNAAGTAGVLELARAFKTFKPAPRRSILFLWPTAEEKGLLGALYYVEKPLYPLASTVANINLDYFSNWGWGRTRDFSIVGLGNSTLDDLTADAVRAQGRTLTGDTAPEQGFYFRSDHYEFARGDVPSLETSPGIDYVGKPADFGTRMRTQYIGQDYHQPSDTIKPGWDLTGAVQDLQVLLDVGYRVAQSDTRPTWKPDAVWRPKPLTSK
jgi:Zn-dependent M28 family amino/carboxypeptidase